MLVINSKQNGADDRTVIITNGDRKSVIKLKEYKGKFNNYHAQIMTHQENVHFTKTIAQDKYEYGLLIIGDYTSLTTMQNTLFRVINGPLIQVYLK